VLRRYGCLGQAPTARNGLLYTGKTSEATSGPSIMQKPLTFALIAVLAVAGCAARQQEAPKTTPQAAAEQGQEAKTPQTEGTAEKGQQAAKSALPQPTAEKGPLVGGAPIDNHVYVIGAEDVLAVRVWNEQQLSGEVIVRPDGRISLPLINEVQAAGLTPEKLALSIAEGLGKFITQPVVNVSVQQVRSKKYYVTGEVGRPGEYPLSVPTTVLEALSKAGGFRDFANQKKIYILRRGQRFRFNYKDVIKGKKMEQNILLESGDQIIVP
jgi:polysaccharide export outer membrane protein